MSKNVRRAVLMLTALTALVAAASALSSGNDDGRPKGTYAFGGGRFGPDCFPGGTFCIALHRDLAFDVHQRDESRARGTISYGRNGAGTGGIQGVVRCISVDGNRAAIGGITPADGNGFVIYVTDNGPVGGATLDESSLMLVDPLDAAVWPPGFPRVCPSPDDNPIGTIPLHSGNLAVGQR